MINTNLNLPQFTLDQLSEQVCRKLPVFNARIATKNMWDGILDLCAEIEKEPRVVNSLIAKVTELYSSQISDRQRYVFAYTTVLTRVYIILYYLNGDDPVFNAVVYPQLVSNMGIYSGDQLTKFIRPSVERIKNNDKLVEQARKEKQKEVEPIVAKADHSGANDVPKEQSNAINEEVENLRKQVEVLEKENTHLKEERAHRSKADVTKADVEKLKKEKEDMIIELLTHIFYEDEKNARDFYERVIHMEDADITSLVKAWVPEKISKKSCHRDLYRILHAAKIYEASESNWNQQLK